MIGGGEPFPPPFSLYREDFVTLKCKNAPVKPKRSAKDAHLADVKLVVNDTARARRISQERFFVHKKKRRR